MMGLEPTTFCMANASVVRARSRPFAQTARLQGLRPSERTRANPSERRTLPFLPRLCLGGARGFRRIFIARAGFERGICDRVSPPRDPGGDRLIAADGRGRRLARSGPRHQIQSASSSSAGCGCHAGTKLRPGPGCTSALEDLGVDVIATDREAAIDALSRTLARYYTPGVAISGPRFSEAPCKSASSVDRVGSDDRRSPRTVIHAG
jgi:hypothetical protein